METEPLLSICLPTCNQSKEFEQTIKSIASQIAPGIEVVVRDDSTNDETEKVVTSYLKKIPIRYFRGKKEGLDVAIIFLSQKARGKYIWWFGNEILTKNSLEKIINTLKKQANIDFLYINSASFAGNVSINLGESRYFKDKNEVVEELADLLGFISATILKRDNVLAGIDNAKKLIGSAWSNFYLALFAVSRSNYSYLLSDIYFLSKPHDPEEKLWYDRFQVFAINFPNVVNQFVDSFNKKSLKVMIAKNFKQVWKGILIHKAKGYNSSFGNLPTSKIFILIKYYWNYLDFWIALPLMLMPRFVLRFFYKVYKLVFPKSGSRLGLN